MDVIAIHTDFREPFGAAKRDAFDPGSAAGDSMPHVFLLGAVPQVLDAIVRRFVVVMIDLSGRMFAVNIEPREPMGVVHAPIDLDLAIPFVITAPGLETCGGIPARDPPKKAAGSLVHNGPVLAAVSRLVSIPCSVSSTQCA
jgi:hypothetical protein